MKKLSKNQSKLIVIKLDIEQNKHIVLVDTTVSKNILSEECNANIYCIDNDDNILWQVKDTKGMFDHDSFVYLEVAYDNKLIAKRFFGKKYLIDITSGEAEEIGWEK